MYLKVFNLFWQYVLAEVEKVKETAHFDVDVNVDFFESKSGVNRLVGGLFKGKSLVYSDISHIVVRVMPKYESEAGENAILVSSHIDTVFSTYVSSLPSPIKLLLDYCSCVHHQFASIKCVCVCVCVC